MKSQKQTFNSPLVWQRSFGQGAGVGVVVAVVGYLGIYVNHIFHFSSQVSMITYTFSNKKMTWQKIHECPLPNHCQTTEQFNSPGCETPKHILFFVYVA